MQDAFGSLDEMLDSIAGRVDAMVLVLPEDSYEAPLMASLGVGVPVYCEKPVAMSAEPLRRLERAAGEAGVTVMVSYMKRFAPAYSRAREVG